MSDKRIDYLTISCFIAFNPILFSLFRPLIPFQHTGQKEVYLLLRLSIVITDFTMHCSYVSTKYKKVIMNFIILLIGHQLY